jgi:post-segregation antitoxin (ccd killing protein)
LGFEGKVKEREEIQMYEEQIAEMKDKLDRKEFFMQNKERKWLEIEKILEEYVHEDDELRDRLLELRVNVSAASTKKISNVVQENDKLKVQLDNAHEEIARMRK